MTSILPYSPAEDWAAKISAAWRRSAESIIETGRLLQEAKDALEHGQWLDVLARINFDDTKARRLMAIGRDERFSNQAILPVLPDKWTEIHALHKLEGEAFERALADPHSIKAERRAVKERDLAAKIIALPQRKYGVILADPPWSFAPYSRKTGMDRAADNHYPTQSIEDICKLDVASIAAPDCVLFLWATVPMLPQALDVMRAWGFEYRSHMVWQKIRPTGQPAIGTGYWFRNCHELMLAGVKGSVPAPAPGDQEISLLKAPTGRHSEKPDEFYCVIEDYFPSLPKIELNSRRARDGWDAWGNEAAGSVSAPVSDGATLIDKNNITTMPVVRVERYRYPENEGIPEFLRRY